MMRRKERTGECLMCGECCKKTRVTAVLSNITSQHGSLEEAGAYYSFHGIQIMDVDEAGDRALLEIDMPCSQLAPDNSCRLNGSPEKKPLICHKYPWFEDDIETCGYSFVEKNGY